MKRTLAILAVLLFVFMAGCRGGTAPMDVEMPDFRGQSYNEVIKGPYRDFRFIFDPNNPDDVVFSDEYPEGTICYQDIEPGVSVNKKATVKIRVSRGVKPLEVPDVYGMAYDYAKQRLGAAGFYVRRVMKASDDVESWHVMQTDPKRDTVLEKGSEVIVYVAADGYGIGTSISE
jgi:Uncharacterized protein conserved in bacteria